MDSIADTIRRWRDHYYHKYDRLPVTRSNSVASSADSNDDRPFFDKLHSSTQFILEDVWDSISVRRSLLALCMLLVSVAAIATTVISALASVPRRPCASLDKPGWIAQSSHSPKQQRSRTIEPLASQTRMSQACADLWISQGELCSSILSNETPLGDTSIDVVWTFIDPSEHWQKWQAVYSTEKDGETAHGTGAKLFRSYNEILSSIRSVIQNIPFADKMFLLGTSLPSTLPKYNATLEEATEDSMEASCRLTQIPEWMDPSTITTADNKVDSKMQLLSYWDLYENAAMRSDQEARAWKEQVLPTFNSHSIESQISNVPSKSETLLYLNEDVFVGRELSPADISTTLFGPVFRVYPASWIRGVETVEEAMTTLDGEGNARSLPNTMRLLDDRFGKRDRNYPEHIGYSLTRSIMDEVAQIWRSELTQTAEVRFRGRGPEYWLPLLVMYYSIEKQREALLWSFFMARSDEDSSGHFSYQERQSMLEALGGRREGGQLIFKTPVRTTGAEEHSELLVQAGATLPAATNFTWSSQVSYPYISKEVDEETRLYPDFGESQKDQDFCSIDIKDCFLDQDFFDRREEGGGGTASLSSSQDIFKHIAFKQPKRCGDCILAGLLRQSGNQGFDAFLPREGATEKRVNDGSSRSIAPLLGMDGKSWTEADFGVKTALSGGEWGKRAFCVRLIQRYSWTIGQSHTSFNELNDDPGWIGWFLWRMQEDASAFMGVNDHVTTTNVTLFNEVKETFMNWQQEMWPNPSPYEKHE